MKTNIFVKRLFFISLLFIGINFVLMPVVNISAAEKPIPNIENGDEKFDRLFREARELMDKGEWKQAVEKFKEIVCDCPEKKYVDAAFYYLAHSYRKLKMYKEAQQTLERLIKNFPESSWADDAWVMLYQLQGVFVTSGNLTYTLSPITPKIVQGTTVGNAGVLETLVSSAQIQLDREDEIKLAAFQSLLAADRKRGIEVLGEILQNNSKTSETVKREAIRTLRTPHFFRGQFSGVSVFYDSTFSPQHLQLLRDTLFRGFRNNPNIKIRSEIIYSLINLNDEPSVNYLSQLYASENEREIKKAIIQALGNAGNSFYYSFGRQVTPLVTATSNKNSSEKAQLEREISAKALTESAKTDSKAIDFKKIYFEKLLEIVRTEKDSELRRLALTNLQRFVGWSTRDGIIEMFLQMYAAESNEEFKTSIIHALGNLKQTQAVNKLLDIAKNDKSNKLRLEAIWALRGNKSPEVIKFLEDLIK